MVKKSWKQNEEAVSPVVATLMLVLITVAAAVGFYVWQAEWQGNTSEQLEDVDTRTPLSIAGSTTVYEFSAVGASYFEENYTQYMVSVQKGGSGAGVTSAGEGIVDIGSSSAALSTEQMTTYPNLVQTLVAYDGVVVIIDSDNTHGLVNINEATLKQIYQCNGGVVGTYALDTDTSGKIEWDEVPKAITNATDMCTGTQVVKIYDRADHSGTEETFSKGMVDTGKNTLEEAGITAVHKTTNQEIVTSVAGDVDAISFTAYGLASASTSGLKMIPFAGDAASGALIDPNASSFKTTCKGGSTAYDGARGLYYITNGAPSGVAKLYVDYVMTPDVNNAICTAAGYISLYA